MIQKRGSTGPLVFTIQEQLNLRMPANPTRTALKTTGKFDVDTEKRVKEFQAMMNLTVTGIVDDVTSAVITQSSFEYEAIPRPIVILQNTSRYHCWAAALSSWTQAVPRVKTISLWQALEDYRKVAGALDEDNEGMTTRGWTHVVKRWGLQYKAYGGSKGSDIDDLTIDKIWRQVKARGPILIAYNLPDTDGEVAHTIVAYGVFIGFSEDNPNFRGYRVWCMNPWRIGRQMMPLADIRTGGAALVMWK
jgi:hypothetical protein